MRLEARAGLLCEGLAQDLAMFGLGGAAVTRGAQLQGCYHLAIDVPNDQLSHDDIIDSTGAPAPQRLLEAERADL